MFGKNIFRTFLYFVVAIVVLKLCYNLGYGLVNRRLTPTTRTAPPETGPTPAPADSAATAPTTPSSR